MALRQLPLGRRIEPNHDTRSLAHPAEVAPISSAYHRMYGSPLDQLQIGSCTGNATCHLRNCLPHHVPKTWLAKEPKAVAVYTRATQIDPYPGSYPDEDTGSDGMSAIKAAIQLGLWKPGTRYTHAFGLDHALGALVKGAWIMGIQWTEDMFYPDYQGFIHPTGRVVGGHELCANQIVVDPAYPGGGYIQGPNSWGITWGLKGYYRMTFKDLGGRLAADGDVTTISV